MRNLRIASMRARNVNKPAIRAQSRRNRALARHGNSLAVGAAHDSNSLRTHHHHRRRVVDRIGGVGAVARRREPREDIVDGT
jgi:hypothetical protein